MSDVKLCKDCVFCALSFGPSRPGVCEREIQKKGFGVAHGVDIERRPGGECGPDAKHFEPKS